MSRNETVYTPVIKKIQEEMDATTDHLSSGRPKNFEEYQRLVGRLEGLQFIEDEVLNIEKKFIED